ncbi:hypothetical protein I4U23_022128 [Adineta vaga]|nr:hypothetical protein I4U23_022128 [Adineta vaga]
MDSVVERIQAIVQYLIDAHIFSDDTTLHEIFTHLKSCNKGEDTDKLGKQVSKLEVIRQKSIDEIRSVSRLHRQLEVLAKILNGQKPISLSFLVTGLTAVFISLIDPVQAEYGNKIVTLVKEKLSDIRKTPSLIVKHRFISELLNTMYDDVRHLESKQSVQNANNYEPYDRLHQHLSNLQFRKDLSIIADKYGFSLDEALLYLSYRDDPDCIDAYENELHRYARDTIESKRSLQNFIETTTCIDKNCFSDENEVKHYNKLFLAYCKRAVKDSDRFDTKNNFIDESTEICEQKEILAIDIPVPNGFTEQPVPIFPIDVFDQCGMMILWLDKHIGLDENCRDLKMEFRRLTNSFKAMDTVKSCHESLSNVKNRKVFCIIQGSLAQEIVPDIEQIISPSMEPVVYIFCAEPMKFTTWAQDYDCIMRGNIFDHEKDLLGRLTRDLNEYVMEKVNEYPLLLPPNLVPSDLVPKYIAKLADLVWQGYQTKTILAHSNETISNVNPLSPVTVQ